MPDTLFNSDLESLTLVNRGKVRDIYAVGDDHLLILTSDRLSAFDVVLPTPIPGKGAVLTAVSNFWFERTRAIIANHLAELDLEDVLAGPGGRRPAGGGSRTESGPGRPGGRADRGRVRHPRS